MSEKTLYMNCRPEDVSEYVIFSGDPWRIEVIKNYLDDVKKISFSREFNTYTGYYKGTRITATSTGIGSPSAAIAMEEMYSCNMKVALRMGTVMSLRDDLLGQFIVPVGSIRREATSKTYVDKDYPAIADFDLVDVISKTIRENNNVVNNGLNCSMDGFYSEMRDSTFGRERGSKVEENFAQLKKLGVIGVDMESSCMMVLGRLMKIKFASLMLVTVLENLKDYLPTKEREEKESLLCQMALESLHRFAERNQDNE